MKKIISISVSKSSFYVDSLKIEFSEKLNCIMGGRGTGKSTIVHFLSAALTQDAEESKATYNVLKTNLGPGLITVLMQDEEGRKYKIVKTIDEIPQCASMPGEKVVSFKSIRNLIECDFYKSQAIEEIGKNPMDRLELIDKMIPEEKSEIEEAIEEISIKLDENAQAIKSENLRLKQFRETMQQYDGVEEEFKKIMQEKPDDIDKNEQKEFEIADKNEKIRSSEKRYVKSVEENLELMLEHIESGKEELSEAILLSDKVNSFFNKTPITAIRDEYHGAIKKLEKLYEDASKLIAAATNKIDVGVDQLEAIHLTQQNEFSKLKQRIEKHKQYYAKWNALSKRSDDYNALMESRKKVKEKRAKIKKLRSELIKKLITETKSLFDLRKERVDEINDLFGGSVKVTLSQGGITEEFEEALRNALKGSNMRYNTLIPMIVDNFPPHRFAEIIHNKDAETLKRISGIDIERSAALITALHETDAIYAIEIICCPDYPEFLLKVDKKGVAGGESRSNYKKSDELSTGQRCTTVLPIVFAVSNNPLIIDQPEDNLDNKYISDTIHEIIREQKESRQLIFITHNPNIPVLSDAEGNFFLNYENKKSSLENKGSIHDVKSNILNLMEGGKDAFMKRELLYGEDLV